MARWNVRARSAPIGALLAAALLCVAAPAAAEVRVTDAGGGRLVVEAHAATLRQVLDALGQSHTIRLKAPEAIRLKAPDALSHQVTGTYTGTLPRVLSRILDGYDHVIISTSSGIELAIVGTVQSARNTGAVSNIGAVTNPVTVSVLPRGPRPVSSNVDADEEAAERKAAPVPQTVNLTPPPHPAAPAIQRPRVPVMGNAVRPRVSSNLDEEATQ